MMTFVKYLTFFLLSIFHKSVSFDFHFQPVYGNVDVTEHENVTVLRHGTFIFNCSYKGFDLRRVQFMKTLDQYSFNQIVVGTRELFSRRTNWTVQVESHRIDADIRHTSTGIRLTVVLHDVDEEQYFCRYTSQNEAHTAKLFTVQVRDRVSSSVGYRLSALSGAEATLPCKFLSSNVSIRSTTWSEMDMLNGHFNTLLLRRNDVYPTTKPVAGQDRIAIVQRILHDVTKYDLIIRRLTPDDAGVYKCKVGYSTQSSGYSEESASLELVIESGPSSTATEDPPPDRVIEAVESGRFNISCSYPSTTIEEAEIRKLSPDESVLHTIVTATRQGNAFTVRYNTNGQYHHQSSARFSNGEFFFTLTFQFFRTEQVGDYECMMIGQEKVHREQIKILLKRDTDTLSLLRAELGSTVRLTCNTSIDNSMLQWQKFMFNSSEFEDLVSWNDGSSSQFVSTLIGSNNTRRFSTVYTSSSTVSSFEIVINAIAPTDAGIYRCVANRRRSDDKGSVTKVIVIDSKESSTEHTPYTERSVDSPGADIALPIGLGVAAVIVVILIMLATFLYIRHRRKGLPVFGSRPSHSREAGSETHYDNGGCIASRDSHKYDTPNVHFDSDQDHVYASADDVLERGTEANPAYAPYYIEPLGSESPYYQEPDLIQPTRVPSGYTNGGYLEPENTDQYIIASDQHI